MAGTPDPVEGYKWLLLAERGGFPDSQRGAREGGGQDRRSRSQARRGAGATQFMPQPERPIEETPPQARAAARDPHKPWSRPLRIAPPSRQARPEVTIAVCRGACRLMRQAGHSVLLEMPLPDGRRADIFAVGRGGEMTIVEVKSSIEDWRVDLKWPDYLDWCDQLYFAVPVDFPQALIPEEIGLIVADAYGGEILRHPPTRPVAAARRKSLLIDCARLASERLARLEDPDFVRASA